MYPVAEQFPNSGRYWRQASNAYGEIRYICPGIFLNNIYEQYGVEGNWNYRYNVADPKYFDAGYGVFHVAEETAVWGPSNTGAVKSSYIHSKLNANAVPTMQGYWTSFIRSYNPNIHRLEGTPTWEAWTKADKQRLLIVTNGTAMEKVDEAQQVRCEYLDSIAESIQQ
ncbi:hypothetical protein MMC12_008431 [Toensbergia leucococca]|nr:hypothetical protein [Toensbergia leucococca]